MLCIVSVNRSSWIAFEDIELFVSEEKHSYRTAVDYGHTNLAASLWLCLSARQYITVAQKIGLTASVYWITGILKDINITLVHNLFGVIFIWLANIYPSCS